MYITKTSKGFAVVNSETDMIFRTLSSYQEADQWREEASTRPTRK